jgi:hypothetical protein
VAAAEGALVKLRGVMSKMAAMQEQLCTNASKIERFSNLFNWSDARITALVIVLIVGAGAVLSLLAALLQSTVGLLPLRKIVFAVGLALLLPPALRQPLLGLCAGLNLLLFHFDWILLLLIN